MKRLALILALLATSAAAQVQPTWRPTESATGFGLVLGNQSQAVLSLACVRGTSEILAIAYAVKPVAGQQELLLRFDQRRVVFVVKPDAIKDGKMVQASAKARPELLASIKSAKIVAGEYGATKLGPYPAPPPALSKTFAERCGPLV